MGAFSGGEFLERRVEGRTLLSRTETATVASVDAILGENRPVVGAGVLVLLVCVEFLQR